ncbi:MAG: glutathione S-transferase [Rhodobacteraceae bacterium]|nr:MAG: glutathione S-transferase [Paracoccaceae bacterium]
MKIKVIYFNFPFWRAEISRISLFYGNIPFEDVRISSDDFAHVRTTGTLPDGTVIPTKALPCLSVDGVSFCQTGAIARFCGKLSGLYPNENNVNCALIDQVIDICTDITNCISYPIHTEGEANRKSFRESLCEKDGKLSKNLNSLESIVERQNCKTKDILFFIDDNLSIGDLAIWGVVKWLKSGVVDFIPTSLIDKYSNLNRILNSVSKIPKIKEWQDKKY